jgi:hypothetical protein
MADFSTEIDIEPSDYVSECSHSEIIELIEILIEDGHLEKFNGRVISKKENTNATDVEWREGLSKLLYSKHLLSNEDESRIIEIVKRLI